MRISTETYAKLTEGERFNVDPRHVPHVGPVILVTPSKALFDWKPEELDFRSLVVRASDGLVISAGFPKFFNYREDKESSRVVDAGLVEGSVKWRKKLDGTLIIRTVVNGHVYFRTRGSHELGAFEDPVMRLIERSYPELLDPHYLSRPGFCDLFEYTAPDNQIVIRYDEPRLWALATIGHGGERLRVFDSFPHTIRGLVEAPIWIMGDEPDEVESELRKLTHEEGYVAWTKVEHVDYHGIKQTCYQLTKWKTSWYLKLHSLRSQASPRFIKEYCVRHNLLDLERFKSQLAKDGFDWEVVSYLEPSFQEFAVRWLDVTESVEMFECLYEHEHMRLRNADRKTLALALKKIAETMKEPWLFNYGITYYTGKVNEAQDILHARVLDAGVNEYRNLKKTWAAEDAARTPDTCVEVGA